MNLHRHRRVTCGTPLADESFVGVGPFPEPIVDVRRDDTPRARSCGFGGGCAPRFDPRQKIEQYHRVQPPTHAKNEWPGVEETVLGRKRVHHVEKIGHLALVQSCGVSQIVRRVIRARQHRRAQPGFSPARACPWAIPALGTKRRQDRKRCSISSSERSRVVGVPEGSAYGISQSMRRWIRVRRS